MRRCKFACLLLLPWVLVFGACRDARQEGEPKVVPKQGKTDEPGGHGRKRTDSLIGQSIVVHSSGVPLRIEVSAGTESKDREAGMVLVFAHVTNNGDRAAGVFSRVQLRDQRQRLYLMIPEDKVPGYQNILGALGKAVRVVPQSKVVEPNSAATVLLAFRVDADAESFDIVPVDGDTGSTRTGSQYTSHDKTILDVQSKHHGIFFSKVVLSRSSDAAVFFHYWEIATLQKRHDLATRTLTGLKQSQLQLGIAVPDLAQRLETAKNLDETSAAKSLLFKLISSKHGIAAGQAFAMTICRLDSLSDFDGLVVAEPDRQELWSTGNQLLLAHLRITRSLADGNTVSIRRLAELDSIIEGITKARPKNLEELNAARARVDGWFDTVVQGIASTD